jgi:hypothetical protein
MKRTAIGAGIGAAVGVLALAAVGAVAGYTQGGEAFARISVPPGVYAACLGAFVYTAYFWWLAGTVGAIIGGLAGFGSWLVRPVSARTGRAATRATTRSSGG